MLRTTLFLGHVILGLALVATPGAARTFSLPQGCDGLVTMQKRGCIVSHLFICEGDPAGHQRRVDLDEDGLSYLGVIDAETQWIESNWVRSGVAARLLPGAAVPASLSRLIATGRDDFDFVTEDSNGFRTRYVGFDILTGETETIDGVTLEVTEFDVTARDPSTGEDLWRTTGREYINRDWRTFVSGIRTTTRPDGSFDNDNRPVTFAFPGEEGYLSADPVYDCGVMMSDTLSRPTPTFLPVLMQGN